MKPTIKFIDLFAGLGGLRLGFEQAFNAQGYKTECVLTSEIKPYAVKTLNENFTGEKVDGDIFKIQSNSIKDFDFLLGGFPCQPFSAGGKRHGFADTRGTLFFEIERLIRDKKPMGFILENVEGLVKHDLQAKGDKIGRTLETILYKLEKELGYLVSWKVLDSINFGLPQSRKRIFIVGTRENKIDLENFKPTFKVLKDILETGLPVSDTEFTKKIFSHFSLDELFGKSIKDKRGGSNNIHSWDIGLKGECSDEQIKLLSTLLKQRRKKHWAEKIGIDWMDGMALTFEQILSFYNLDPNVLKSLLDDLVTKGYLRFEHPKKLVNIETENGIQSHRVYDFLKPKGYNIVTGKLSFEINKILNPNDIAPTIVATDVSRLAVPDIGGIRKLTIREGLRLFGYPENFNISAKESEAFDLLGNTVAIPVVKAVVSRVVNAVELNFDKRMSGDFIETL